jgi:N-acetylmuramoyl-L-alanine amidase
MEGEKFYLKECLFMSNIWYLSPSRQPENVGINGYGNEQEQMYILTDAITPHLDRCGVSFHVADPEETLAQRCRESNDMEAFYHLALHSNAAPEGRYGEERGIIAFYYPGSVQGQRAAELFAEELREIYPLPDRVTNELIDSFPASDPSSSSAIALGVAV